MSRLRLDRDACQGHGRCYGTFPDAFEPDDEGYAVARFAEIPTTQAAAAACGGPLLARARHQHRAMSVE